MSGKFLEEVGFWEVIGKQDDVDKAHFPQAGVLGGHKVDWDWNHLMERKKTRKSGDVGSPTLLKNLQLFRFIVTNVL